MPRGQKGDHKGWARQCLSPKETDKELQAEKQATREEEDQGKRVEMGLQVTPERRNLQPQKTVRMKLTTSKGVGGLINIKNPNQVAQTIRQVTQLDLDRPKELSRREEDDIEKKKQKSIT